MIYKPFRCPAGTVERQSINKSSRGLQSGTSRCNALPASQQLLIHVNSGGFAMECSLSVPRSALQPVAMVLQAMEQLPMFS